ncbi:peroxidase 5-like [Ananas comosus]|uniref:Peroxidase n=1 Tax=Ananas comosus TaxID=4615 RepID=A0A6P5FMH8_ANACO|nr:peroxidase 5-like [Ananas comosus]
MAMRCGKVLLATILCLFLGASSAQGELVEAICNTLAQVIVKDEVTKAFNANSTVAPALLRLHFHDCFVRGCDGSVLLDSTPDNTAEKDAPPNKTLRGFEIIDAIKQRLENSTICAGKVSCADILTYASRDSVVLAGGPFWPVTAGRKDGIISRANETSALPSPRLNLTGLLANFAANNLTEDDLIALSGAHTIGHAHCGSFSNRLYSFNATTPQDPSLNSTYAGQLKESCPVGNLNSTVPMDPVTPDKFDTTYYSDVLLNEGLFQSDAALLSTPSTADKVRLYAGNTTAFNDDFVNSIIKMGAIAPPAGSYGEVRVNCRVVNPL